MDTNLFEPVEEDEVMVALKMHNAGFSTAFTWGDEASEYD
jgi:hypothetical protein